MGRISAEMPDDTHQRYSLTLDGSGTCADRGSEWARAMAGQAGVPEDRVAAIDLCIVELVTNIVSHSYRGEPGEIRLDLDLDGEAAVLTVTDTGPAFDPLSVPAPVVAASIEEAPIGGLGIQMVRSSASACEYARRDGRNVFTARFR